MQKMLHQYKYLASSLPGHEQKLLSRLRGLSSTEDEEAAEAEESDDEVHDLTRSPWRLSRPQTRSATLARSALSSIPPRADRSERSMFPGRSPSPNSWNPHNVRNTIPPRIRSLRSNRPLSRALFVDNGSPPRARLSPFQSGVASTPSTHSLRSSRSPAPIIPISADEPVAPTRATSDSIAEIDTYEFPYPVQRRDAMSGCFVGCFARLFQFLLCRHKQMLPLQKPRALSILLWHRWVRLLLPPFLQ